MPIILLDSLGDVVGKILSSHCRGGVKVPYKGATLDCSWKNKKIRISITSDPSMIPSSKIYSRSRQLLVVVKLMVRWTRSSVELSLLVHMDKCYI